MDLEIATVNQRPSYRFTGVEFTGDKASTFIHEKGRRWRLTKHYTTEGTMFYSFGVFDLDPEQRPGHGGEWSSNSTHINELFGVNIIECSVNRWACAIDKDTLNKLK